MEDRRRSWVINNPTAAEHIRYYKSEKAGVTATPPEENMTRINADGKSDRVCALMAWIQLGAVFRENRPGAVVTGASEALEMLS